VLEMSAATRDFTEYEVNVHENTVLVRTPEPLPVTAGDAIRFAVSRDDVKVFDYGSNARVLDSEALSDEVDQGASEGLVDAGSDSSTVADAIE
jgi:hypothetical protein